MRGGGPPGRLAGAAPTGGTMRRSAVCVYVPLVSALVSAERAESHAGPLSHRNMRELA